MKTILIGFGVFVAVGFAGMAFDNDLVFAAAAPAALLTWIVVFFVNPGPSARTDQEKKQS